MSTYTVTIPVTVNKETREVEFRVFQSGAYGSSASIFAARIGSGAKLHRTEMTACVFDSAAAATAKGYKPSQIVEVDGSFYGLRHNATVRNRPATITDWADNCEGTRSATQQVYYGSL